MNILELLIENIANFASYVGMLFRVLGGSLSTSFSTTQLIGLIVPASLVGIVVVYYFFSIVYNVIRSVL